MKICIVAGRLQKKERDIMARFNCSFGGKRQNKTTKTTTTHTHKHSAISSHVNCYYTVADVDCFIVHVYNIRTHIRHVCGVYTMYKFMYFDFISLSNQLSDSCQH